MIHFRSNIYFYFVFLLCKRKFQMRTTRVCSMCNTCMCYIKKNIKYVYTYNTCTAHNYFFFCQKLVRLCWLRMTQFLRIHTNLACFCISISSLVDSAAMPAFFFFIFGIFACNVIYTSGPQRQRDIDMEDICGW